MPSHIHCTRPFLSRKRSNSVPTLGFANVSAEEANILISAAERATARRKRPMSVDSPGPAIETDGRNVDIIPARSFNFSTPSRLGLGQSPLRTVRRTVSVKSEPLNLAVSPSSDDAEDEEEEVEPTPLASTFPASAMEPQGSTLPQTPVSPRRVVDNPVLKAYADGLLNFTQSRLNSIAPETLRTLGLKREPSPRPPTPELEATELPETSRVQPRPIFSSKFSDWSSTRASSITGPSSPPSPREPRTPEDQATLMTPDSFFAEVTPRVAQTAAWAAATSSRFPAYAAEGSFFIDSPTIGDSLQRRRTDSITTSEAYSYFAGFDGVTDAVGTRLSMDMSPMARRLQNAGFMPRSQPGSSASNYPPFLHHQASHSPYSEMAGLVRTPSWQVPALG